VIGFIFAFIKNYIFLIKAPYVSRLFTGLFTLQCATIFLIILTREIVKKDIFKKTYLKTYF